MTPADAIAMLDRELAAHGEPVTLRRITGTTSADVQVRAHVRGYRPDELVGGIDQDDTKVVLSPTEIVAAGWPLPVVKNDRLIVQGRVRNVMAAAPVYIAGVLVRIDLQVRG